jgi:hypothetical protein
MVMGLGMGKGKGMGKYSEVVTSTKWGT